MSIRKITATLTVLLVLQLGDAGTSLHGAVHTERERKIKAAFIYNFLLFTNWRSVPVESSRLTLGILSKDSFGRTEFAALESKMIPAINRTFSIICKGSYEEDTDISECNAVFISDSEKKSVENILKKLGNAPVLTISDCSGFARSGGMIELVIIDNQFRWRINAEAIKRSSLKVNSQIYRNAIEVINQ